ncbi:hypothetical protein BX616_001191 [Lobosporangium transversale]|nr:hypothetical protein BX616_001191 [Lobosporangium transversale]
MPIAAVPKKKSMTNLSHKEPGNTEAKLAKATQREHPMVVLNIGTIQKAFTVRKGSRGFRDKTRLVSLEDMQRHTSDNFEPVKGFILSEPMGSVSSYKM